MIRYVLIREDEYNSSILSNDKVITTNPRMIYPETDYFTHLSKTTKTDLNSKLDSGKGFYIIKYYPPFKELDILPALDIKDVKPMARKEDIKEISKYSIR